MKYNLSLICVLGIICSANVNSAMAQQQQQQTYTISIPAPMLDTIGKGLGELPFKDAAPVMQYLQQQVIANQQKVAKPEEKKSEEKKD